jgi:hypothetical protein
MEYMECLNCCSLYVKGQELCDYCKAKLVNPTKEEGRREVNGAIVEQCEGCGFVEDEHCRIWVSPKTKWRMGPCTNATHIIKDKKVVDERVRVGQQKSKKKTRR